MLRKQRGAQRDAELSAALTEELSAPSTKKVARVDLSPQTAVPVPTKPTTSSRGRGGKRAAATAAKAVPRRLTGTTALAVQAPVEHTTGTKAGAEVEPASGESDNDHSMHDDDA